MEGAQELAFTVDDIIKMLGAGAVVISGYYFLKNHFERNAEAIAKLDTRVIAVDSKLDTKFDAVNTELQKQAKTIVRIEAHGTVLEERIQAMAGPRR